LNSQILDEEAVPARPGPIKGVLHALWPSTPGWRVPRRGQGLSAALASVIGAGLPKFYVNVLFHEIAAEDF
jgi:hypothetical protein